MVFTSLDSRCVHFYTNTKDFLRALLLASHKLDKDKSKRMQGTIIVNQPLRTMLATSTNKMKIRNSLPNNGNKFYHAISPHIYNNNNIIIIIFLKNTTKPIEYAPL